MKTFLLFFIFTFLFIVKTQDCNTINVKNVLAHLIALNQTGGSSFGGNRAAGTEGYQKSVTYIINRLATTNLKVSIQDFTFTTFAVEKADLTKSFPTRSNYTYNVDYSVMSGSGSGSFDRIVAPVPNKGCSAADWNDFITGRIALVERGDCTFNEKFNFGKNLASAIIIYNNNDDLFRGSVNSSATIPVLSVPRRLGISWAQELAVLTLTIQTKKEISFTQNVLAETIVGNENSVIVVGSHLDSVTAGPGINDNGSGSATNLELALTIARCEKPQNKIRFAWWGAEELGLLGSTHYVTDLVQNNPAELSKIALNINIDMLGSPNYFYGIYNGSSAPAPIREKSALIQKEFETFFLGKNLPFKLTPFDGRSDYGPFIERGIPAGGLFTGAEQVKDAGERILYLGLANAEYDPCYHAYCDTFENLSETALEANSGAVLEVVKKLATSSLEKIKNQPTSGNVTLFYATHPNAFNKY